MKVVPMIFTYFSWPTIINVNITETLTASKTRATPRRGRAKGNKCAFFLICDLDLDLHFIFKVR